MKCFVIAIVVAFVSTASASPPVELAKGLFEQPGKCPDVPFVKDFDSDKFVGKWFSIKQFNPFKWPCVSYELTKPTPTSFKSVLTPGDRVLDIEQAKADDVSQGYTVITEKMPLWYGGNLRVFATDYGESRGKI
jgi:hypothetical protein